MSLETAIIIATALMLTLPIGWWVSRKNREQEPAPTIQRTLTSEERAALLTELRVIVMRGEARASEGERVMRSATMRELRNEGLGPTDLEGLSAAGVYNLWVCHRLAFGSDSEAGALLNTIDPALRGSWTRIRAKVKRERDTEARREAETEWVAKNREEYDRLTLVASGAPAITQWLTEQGPTVWHAVALGLSPERIGFGPWLWLADQPSLDRATAIGMFLKSEPHKAVMWTDEDITGPRRDQVAMLRKLARRLANEEFSGRAFCCPAPSRSTYFKAQERALKERTELPWVKLGRHALGPMEGAEARTAYSVDGGTRVRKRVDLAPYVSGQRRA